MASSASQIAVSFAQTGPTGIQGEQVVSIAPDATGGTEESQILVLLQASLREHQRTNALLLALLDALDSPQADLDDDVVDDTEPEEILAPGDGAA
jgi:hypothetical protein